MTEQQTEPQQEAQSRSHTVEKHHGSEIKFDPFRAEIEQWFFIHSPRPFSWIHGWQNDAVDLIMEFVQG